ncbi:MAG: type II toxin-antitoxin system VapC family toxin [Candidatus Dormibacteria bacterium]
MQLVDVNVLVYAYREDAHEHARYHRWLQSMLGSETAYGLADLVLSGFLRVVTHPRVFDPPSPLDHALGFVEAIRAQPNAVPVSPGSRHWDIFTRLCRTVGTKGNLVPDAYLAALAIESGSEWMTTDHDYSRFPGLRWRHPLQTVERGG